MAVSSKSSVGVGGIQRHGIPKTPVSNLKIFRKSDFAKAAVIIVVIFPFLKSLLKLVCQTVQRDSSISDILEQ